MVRNIAISPIHSYEACRDFVESFRNDPIFSDPMLSNNEQLHNNLLKAIKHPQRYQVLGFFLEGRILGLFSFLVIPEEKYAEMIVGLSRDEAVYTRLMTYLEDVYLGYQLDFVFNPGNHLLKEALQAKAAQFDTEQQKMVLSSPPASLDAPCVELFSEKYARQYFEIHGQDVYWTGEKVAATPEKFRILLAIQDGNVAGYLDVTHCFEENEPYDLFVLPEYRRKGYARQLLAKALELNAPRSMMLLVEVDNTAAIQLYESMGFQAAPNENSLTVHWKCEPGRMRML